MRTSSSVSSLISIPTLPALTGKSDGGFQAVLALASETGISGNGSNGSGAGMLAGENAASFLAALREESQSPAVEAVSGRGEAGARPTPPAAPPDQQTTANKNVDNAGLQGTPVNAPIGSRTTTLAVTSAVIRISNIPALGLPAPVQYIPAQNQVSSHPTVAAAPVSHEKGAKKNAANAALVGTDRIGLKTSSTATLAVARAASRISNLPELARPVTVQSTPAQSQVSASPNAASVPADQETAANKNVTNAALLRTDGIALTSSGTTTLAAASPVGRISNMPELAQAATVQTFPSQSQASDLPTPLAVPAYQETAARKNAANAPVEAAPASFQMDSATTTRATVGSISRTPVLPELAQPSTVQYVAANTQARVLPTSTAFPADQETAAKSNAANVPVAATPASFQMDSTTTTRAATSTVSRFISMPELAQPATVQSTPSQSEVSALPSANPAPGDPKSNSTEDASLEQSDINMSSDGASESSATPANAVDLRSSATAPQAPAQLPSTPLVPNASATIQTARSPQLLNSAPSFDAIADEFLAAQIIPTTLPIGSPSAPSAQEQVPAPVDVPMASALPSTTSNGATASQPVGKSASKEASDAAGAKNSVPANTANQASSKTAETAGGPHDVSSHGAQNNDQPSQSLQANPSQTAAAMQKVGDGNTAQIQVHAVVMPSAPQENGAAHSTPGSLADAPRAIDQRDVPASMPSDSGEAVATAGINSAKLIQAMSETEMRVGMHSTEFGDISIRTSVSQQQMLAQISLDHSELSQAISDHISAVQSKLGSDYGLHASIEINSHGSSFSHGSEQSSQRDQKAFASSVRAEFLPEPAEADTGTSLGTLVAAGNGHRLDIRA